MACSNAAVLCSSALPTEFMLKTYVLLLKPAFTTSGNQELEGEGKNKAAVYVILF